MGYPIGAGLVPSGFRGSFAEWFAYSTFGPRYPIGIGLIPSEFCVSSAARLTVLRFSYLLFICMLWYLKVHLEGGVNRCKANLMTNNAKLKTNSNTLSVTKECNRIPGEGLWTISSKFL